MEITFTPIPYLCYLVNIVTHNKPWVSFLSPIEGVIIINNEYNLLKEEHINKPKPGVHPYTV